MVFLSLTLRSLLLAAARPQTDGSVDNITPGLEANTAVNVGTSREEEGLASTNERPATESAQSRSQPTPDIDAQAGVRPFLARAKTMTLKERREKIYVIARACRKDETYAWHNGVSVLFMQFGMFEDAIKEADLALQAPNEDHWQARVGKSQIYLRQNKIAEALSMTQELIKEFNDNPLLIETYQESHWMHREQLADLLYQAGRYADCLEECKSIFAANPESYYLLAQTLDILRIQGRLSEALQILQQLDNENDDGDSRLVSAFRSIGDDYFFEDAFEAARLHDELPWLHGVLVRAEETAARDKDFYNYTRMRLYRSLLHERYLNQRDAGDSTPTPMGHRGSGFLHVLALQHVRGRNRTPRC